MRAFCFAAALAGLFVSPLRAAAFSDYELFTLPPLEGGGGGGRYFTGSSSDGYGCAVCHTGGPAPLVEVRGLPEREFAPGAAYDVEVVWSSPELMHALSLELVTPQGLAAGSITLPSPESLQPADRCDAMHAGESAAHIIEESSPRQVLYVNGCGAQRVRFRFTAPANDLHLMFAASVVRSDNSEKPDGDGVTELRRTLSRQGYAPSSAAGCSALPGFADRRALRCFSLLGMALLLLVARRRRPR